ncbi:MAG: glycosyltransferase family 1 protein [Ignavibacteriales bacterium]|nr:MAG: glycosyltransferase family 1 protein [Ignavibacteriales bacterium]
MLKILHVAPQNYAGVPHSFYQMHNAMGDYSRIVTLHKNPLEFPEDICLDLPLPSSSLAKKWRKKKINDVEDRQITLAPVFRPKNLFERIYFKYSDAKRKKIIDEAINKYKLDEFDIIHYDSGLDFYRNSTQAKKWKREGKKIVCCYYGSDLRIRGLIKEMDAISDLNITSEYDHLELKKDLQYIFYPYDISELPERKYNDDGVIKIVHSPTNRQYKGTSVIISVIEKIKKEHKIEFILLEGKPRSEVLGIKSTCDISIDQVGGTMGGTGYGKAGLETLGIGIPTITNMTKNYADWLPENPFVVANNANELYNVLLELIQNATLRKEKGEAGKNWVKKYHSYESVDKRLKELYRTNQII